MIEKLDGNYIRGYTQALTDLLEDLPGAYADCKHHKKVLNKNKMIEYINERIINREKLREHKNGFIRFNGKLQKWEWFERE